MIKPSKNLKLFINSEEYDFNHEINFSLHPINFSYLTFNNVIAKRKNKFPMNVENIFVQREFSLVELFDGDQLIWFGVLNDIGRLSLFPNKIKDFSIKVADFRKWLSLSKPINKLYLNKTPNEIVGDVIAVLAEPRISIGTLDFTSNERIAAYNSTNKNAYQILKEVITRQSNSLLYFTIENGQILVNYKSNKTLKDHISPIILDLNDKIFLTEYGILDAEYESNTDNYSNFLSYSSENTISEKPIVEKNLKMDQQKIVLLNNPALIDPLISSTFIKNTKTGAIRPAIILNSSTITTGKRYDLIFSQNSNILDVFLPNADNELTISYFIKKKITFEVKNDSEISLLAEYSNTSGIIHEAQKFNDISNPSDLLRAVKSDLEFKSNPNKVLIIKSTKPIWSLTDVVKFNSADSIGGIYLVHQVTGFITSNLAEYEYSLNQTKNLDNLVNQFDNQSYRDNPASINVTTSESLTTLSGSIILISTTILEEKIVILQVDQNLQTPLQVVLNADNPTIKFKFWRAE